MVRRSVRSHGRLCQYASIKVVVLGLAARLRAWCNKRWVQSPRGARWWFPSIRAMSEECTLAPVGAGATADGGEWELAWTGVAHCVAGARSDAGQAGMYRVSGTDRVERGRTLPATAGRAMCAPRRSGAPRQSCEAAASGPGALGVERAPPRAGGLGARTRVRGSRRAMRRLRLGAAVGGWLGRAPVAHEKEGSGRAERGREHGRSWLGTVWVWGRLA